MPLLERCEDDNRRDEDRLPRAALPRDDEPVRRAEEAIDDEVRRPEDGGLVALPSLLRVAEEDIRRELDRAELLRFMREDVPTCDVEYLRLVADVDLREGDVYAWELESRREEELMPDLVREVEETPVRDLRVDLEAIALGCGCSEDRLFAYREELEGFEYFDIRLEVPDSADVDPEVRVRA